MKTKTSKINTSAKKQISQRDAFQPGVARMRHASKNSQAHPGVSPLNPINHRNTSFQPLPRPLGLAPYHYSLDENFPAIAGKINSAKKMVLHVLGDSGGV